MDLLDLVDVDDIPFVDLHEIRRIVKDDTVDGIDHEDDWQVFA